LFGNRLPSQNKAHGADAWTGRVPIDWVFSTQESRNDTLKRPFRIDFRDFFRPVAAHGVTQKPTPLINQGLRHDFQ
jgi:hypothetical protein